MKAAVGSDDHILSLAFLVLNACSMGFGLLCITTSTLCLMFGREKALMGGGGSNEDAI